MGHAGILLVVGVLGISQAPNLDKQPTGTVDQVLKRFVDEFVVIVPGKEPFPPAFEMGTKGAGPETEKPAHTVTLRSPFAMARYEVTQELYEAVMGTNPSKWKGPRNSVEMVDWHQANEFCTRVTAMLRERKLIQPQEAIRLPTEAEWEYACRAGTSTAYCFGDDVKLLDSHAWHRGNSKGEDPPVGKKKPNAWGLYDMHGYIWEWCIDAWHPTYAGAPADGSAWKTPDAKACVIRGGSWADPADHSRSAYRTSAPVGERNDRIGFRCVREGR